MKRWTCQCASASIGLPSSAMRQIHMLPLVAVLTFAAATTAAAPVVPVSTTTDQPGKTPSGATFTIPKGWAAQSGATSIVLSSPETDTHIAVVDIATAKDAAGAVSQAWTIYRPTAHPFVVATRGGRRALIIRDGQHEYVYAEGT